MNSSTSDRESGSDGELAPFISHGSFRDGLAKGRFRVVVNPMLARPYVVQRLRANVFAVTLIGLGAVLALSQHAAVGGTLVVMGIVLSRVIRHQAGRIVLHLAAKDPQVYMEVTGNGVMEVREVREA